MVTKEQIDELKKKADEVYQEYCEYKEAIEALQKICAHNMIYQGHGNNFDLYRCEKCGVEEHS